jgi:GNAT superfamily N-acetyltransferase
LFGGDREPERCKSVLDPASDAAKIRAFFVLPHYSRRGVGSLILRECESEAWRHGFRKLELMATLPGLEFYRKHGFKPGAPINHRLNEHLTIEFMPMSKRLESPEL